MPIPLALAEETGRCGNLPVRQQEDLLQDQKLEDNRGRHRAHFSGLIRIGAHLHTHLHIPEHTHIHTTHTAHTAHTYYTHNTYTH